jgi:hypothetical protein
VPENIASVLRANGMPANVQTRDDGIWWQWTGGGLDCEVMTDDDLVVREVLVARSVTGSSTPPKAGPQPADLPLLGAAQSDAAALLVSRGATPVAQALKSEADFSLDGALAVLTLDESQDVVRVRLADNRSATADGHPATHTAVRMIKAADFASTPHGVGVAVSEVRVDARGAVVWAGIIASSGDHAIDDWVLENARRSTYAPATCAGEPCSGVYVDIDGML